MAEEQTQRRLLVDAMNVIGSRPDGWWRDRRAAAARLVERLERYAARSGARVTVVFESEPRPALSSEAIETAHAPRPGRDAADDEIFRLVSEDSDPGSIEVVTSDRALADRVRALGARVQAASAFRAEIERA